MRDLQVMQSPLASLWVTNSMLPSDLLRQINAVSTEMNEVVFLNQAVAVEP